MSQNNKLVDELKVVLREKGVTYNDVASNLELSEGSIKRIFSNYDFTLSRLEKICFMVEMELFDLVDRAKEKELSTEILSVENEKELVSNIPLLLVAHLLLNKWSVHQILNGYDIDRLSMTKLLSKLDRMCIIDYLPNERVRLKISRNFKWIEKGPIQEFFNKNIESEFFDCNFTSLGEIKIFSSGMLTKASNKEIQRKIKSLILAFDGLHKGDEKEDLSDKFGTSVMVAMRPWDIKAFNNLKRSGVEKVFR